MTINSHPLNIKNKPHTFLLSSRVCVFADASLRHRHGEGLLHQCDQRHRRRGVSVSGLRSDTPQLPAGRLLLRPLPRRVLHRQRHQPMPGVPAQHAPGRAPHLRAGRVCRLWAWKREQQGKETGCHRWFLSVVMYPICCMVRVHVFAFLSGTLSMLQRLLLHPHGEQPHADL